MYLKPRCFLCLVSVRNANSAAFHGLTKERRTGTIFRFHCSRGSRKSFLRLPSGSHGGAWPAGPSRRRTRKTKENRSVLRWQVLHPISRTLCFHGHVAVVSPSWSDFVEMRGLIVCFCPGALAHCLLESRGTCCLSVC